MRMTCHHSALRWVRTAAAAVLGGVLLCAASPSEAADPPAAHPPIPVKFTLAEPGFVTLVIEDATGHRVRNLVSETPFPAGENTVWWDGLDDLDRNPDAAEHSIYHIPGKLVAPGNYQVRGLYRKQIDLRYIIQANAHGSPPWATKDRSSDWLTNHTPPMAVCAVPAGVAPVRGTATTSPAQVLIGSFVAEGGSGLAWVDLSGRKLHGQMWLGGIWTASQYLTRDAGTSPVPGVYAYSGTAWEGDGYNGNMPELRLHKLVNGAGKLPAPRDTRLGVGEDPQVLTPTYKFPDREHAALGGLAARDGVVVVALTKMNQLLFVDVAGAKVLGTAAMPQPGGLAFDAQGKLLVLTGKQLVRVAIPAKAEMTEQIALPTPEVVIANGLQDPQGIAIDAKGQLYITDRGTSHQVKVFSSTGKLVRTIGTPGAPKAGKYDPRHMNNPKGVTLTSDGHIWVAEEDFQPKRISIWTLDGKLVDAFYGPPRYGGGGEVDSKDASIFYTDGVQFKLDPTTGKSWPLTIYYRPGGNDLQTAGGWGVAPQSSIYHGKTCFMTNAHNVNPTTGAGVATVWMMRKGIAYPCAAMGRANDWPIFATASAAGSANQDFSVRWTGQVAPKYSETYTFTTATDDGVRLWVNDKLLVDKWQGQGTTEWSGEIALEAGKRYDIKMEYFQGSGGAVARLLWASPSQAKQIIPTAALYPTKDATTATGLTASYYKGTGLSNAVVTQTDATVDFDWSSTAPKVFQPKEADPFLARYPKDFHPGERLFFIWSDLNTDAHVQPNEVNFVRGESGNVGIMSDLSAVVSRFNGQAVRFAASGFTKAGVPFYNISTPETLAVNTQGATSSGGDEVLVSRDGWTVLTTAPKPYAPQGMGGVYKGEPMWSYPSLWPGLHASHIAPMPQQPGEMIGTTRLLGNTVTPRNSDAGELWAINGNKGTLYLMTVDGLFVATLFKDCRTASWNFPEAKYGMLVNDASLSEENFWPSIAQTSDGNVYLTAYNADVINVSGLETIKRLPKMPLTLTQADLQAAQAYFVQSEAERQRQQQDPGPLTVAMKAAAPVVDGKLDDWADAKWATIDVRTELVGDWGKREAKTTAALTVSGDKLYAAYRTGDANLLNNAGDSLPMLFKTGGALDLMVGAINGGERLLITQVNGKPVAALYRPKVPGTTTDPVLFSSPLRTVPFDRVDEVTDQVTLASGGDGNYEVAVPLALLGLTATDGQTIAGDIGVLRGNGFRTLQRVYWRNKATGLVSDVPSEAELTPQLWGKWTFTKAQ